MENNFLLHNKIVWHGNISNDLSSLFYPSFYKAILKRESIFIENFKALFENATTENIKTNFIPLYKQEIMGRDDFTLNRETIVESILERIEKNPSKYTLLSIRDNNNNLYGVAIFSIKENQINMAFKVYRRDINIKALKHKASLDYWGEKLIRNYAFDKGLSIFSYGRDSQPYIGQGRIGLSLYKLKTGTKPKVPDLNTPEKPVETKMINDAYLLSQEKPLIFFTNPANDNFYQNCYLYYPKNSIHEPFINEFKVVSEWAGIAFKSIAY